MDWDEIVPFLAAFGLVFSPLAVVSFLAWRSALKRAERAEALVDALRGESRLETKPLRDVIDSMALEIERIGESQRFLTRVLAESREVKRSELQIGPEGRIPTPH